MKKYLFIVLLVGVWSCDIDSNNEKPSLIGEWEYYDYSYSLTNKYGFTLSHNDITEVMDSCFQINPHNRQIESNHSLVITTDSVFIYWSYLQENPSESKRLIFSNDTLFKFFGDNDTIRFNLNENLTLFNIHDWVTWQDNRDHIEIDKHYRRIN